jgi:secretion/DNA translocation related TadE-like protein
MAIPGFRARLSHGRVRGSSAGGGPRARHGDRRNADRGRATAAAKCGRGRSTIAGPRRPGCRRSRAGRGTRRQARAEQAGCARVRNGRCAHLARAAARDHTPRVVVRARRFDTRMIAGENGSGSLLGLAIAGALAAMMVMTLPLYIGLSARESVARAADASALAGADVAAGLSGGVPCTVARSVAAANRAALGACRVDGLVVTVTTGATFLGLRLTASAAAGPPGAVSIGKSKSRPGWVSN